MGQHQQAVGEPDADQQQATDAQQGEGRADADGGKACAPEQQRGFADAAPFDRQIQGGGCGEGDRKDQQRRRVESHGLKGLSDVQKCNQL
ncbi:hypothetical protein D3C73_1569830 [compost metagenome]